MIEAVKEYSGVDFDSFTLDDAAAKKLQKSVMYMLKAIGTGE